MIKRFKAIAGESKFDCYLDDSIKLNLGSGNDYREGYVNVDSSEDANPDVLCNIDGNKLPFKDNSVDEVVASMILEHVRDLDFLFKEIYRVCKNKAKIIIDVPYFSSESAFSHYQHVSFFSWTTFDLFNPNHSEHFHTGIKFKITKRYLKSRFLKKYTPFNLFPRIYQEYLCWIFPVRAIHFELEVIK